MIQQELWTSGNFKRMDLDDFDRIESTLTAVHALLTAALAADFEAEVHHG